MIKDAVKILHDRYIGDDREREASVERERMKAHVARAIYALRTKAGVSQAWLANLVGTTQPVISQLENADYKGNIRDLPMRLRELIVVVIGGRT